MPIEAMYWDWEKRAVEVHVLAGTTSVDLRVKHLRFQRRDTSNDPEYPYAKAHMDGHPSDVTLTFTIADATKAAGSSTRSFASRGITVNGATGEVTVKPATGPDPLPALFPQNFLLEAHATSGGLPFRELIRVHVHKSIKNIWLTPGTLKVRARRAAVFPTSTNARFALRARFDDESVGDITDWDGIEWTSHRAGVPVANVNSDGSLNMASGDPAAAPITVEARLTAHPGVAAASATYRPLDPWRPEDPINVRLVPGGGLIRPKSSPPEPLPFAPEAVANVLFLPDGFPPASGEEFFQYVTSLVAFIKTNSVCKPYDVLINSINFWAAYIQSDGTGITFGSEVFASTTPSGALVVFAVPKPKRPLDTPVQPKWDLSELIYEVGLPAPADRPANATTRTNAAIEQDWNTLFGSTAADHLPSDVDKRKTAIDAWRDLGTRTILDDVDTPLGMMSGAPRVDSFHDLIDLNPDRMSREHLDDLMAALRHENAAHSAVQLNTLWTDRRKRNYDLVCLVTLGQGREINSFGYFTLSQQVFFQDCTVSGVNDIVPAPPPFLKSDADPGEMRTFVHELSHSFELGDEYGGFNDRPLFPADVAHAHRTECNLQSPDSLKAGLDIVGEEVKWRWPRIRWAAEIIGPITEASGKFEAPIRMSHAFAFPIGEIVHLRFRNIHFAFRDIETDGVHYDDESSYLVKLPLVSVPLRLEAHFDAGTPAVKHVRLRVDAAVPFDYPAGRKIDAAAIIATFTPGSIVYCPTRAPAGAFDAATYPYAELIAKNVRDLVTFRHGATGHSNSDLSLPEAPMLMSMPVPSWFPAGSLPFIVGLYEGGMGNVSGIFHPTGSCMMNDQNSGVRFCHVCRYVLVDALDPSKHYFIDPEYTAIYPQR